GRDPSADLADVNEIVLEDALRLGEDPAGLVVAAARHRHEVDVRGDAADVDRAPEEAADGGLQVGPLPLGDVLEERLRLGEAEGHDVAIDRHRAALGDDRARGGPDRVDDLRPAGEEAVEVGAGGGDWWRGRFRSGRGGP